MNETGKQDLNSTLQYTTTRSPGTRENSIAFLVTSDAPFRDCAQAKLGFEIKSVSPD